MAKGSEFIVLLLVVLRITSGSSFRSVFLSDYNASSIGENVSDVENDIEVEPEEQLQSTPMLNTKNMQRLWGVPDLEVFVGQLMVYRIPDDAFHGDLNYYEVKDIPSWLHWDAKHETIEGVPLLSDRGQHYITLVAVGKDGSNAKDVFVLRVTQYTDVTLHQKTGCPPKEDLTVVAFVLDTYLPMLNAKDRVKLLQSATEMFLLDNPSLTAAEMDPILDDTAILAGPGSAKSEAHSRGLTQVQWVVGCAGRVEPNHEKVINQLKVVAKDGRLENAVGLPVLGWHLYQMNPFTNRVRRQAEFSGDYEYNYEYSDNDNFGDYEYPGMLEPKLDTKTPDPRLVPSLVSPVPTGITPSIDIVPVSVDVALIPTELVTLEPSPTLSVTTPTESDLPSYVWLESSFSTEPSVMPSPTSPIPVAPTEFTAQVDSSKSPTVTPTPEFGSRNFAPKVKTRIDKMAWVAGHLYRLNIPINTFEDVEDDAVNLRIGFKTSDGGSIGRNSWIQYDPIKREIYALPLEDNIGKYTYFLEAIDSEGKSVTESVAIHVQQPREARNFNHEFSVTFKLEKKVEFDFIYSLDWQAKAVEKIARVAKQSDTDAINVRAISSNPIVVTWTNTSLVNPRSAECPADDLQALKEMLMYSDAGEPTREFRDAFQPEFVVKKVSVHYRGPCEGLSQTTPLAGSVAPPAGVPKVPGGTKSTAAFGNDAPIFRNQIDILTAMQGHIFRYQVPIDTCYDLEDGDSRRLKMRLLTSNLSPPLSTSWLQFDVANQEFFGIPLAGDEGSTEYILECIDSGGEKVNDALMIEVKPRIRNQLPPLEFSITVDTVYQQFMSSATRKVLLVQKIAAAFGDSNVTNVAVSRMNPGSVRVTWTNSSLTADPCPHDQIKQLINRMLDDQNQLQKSFIQSFIPDFKVTSGYVQPGGSCLGEDTPIHHSEDEYQHPVGPDEERVREEENNYLVNFIVPAVIIAAMLILAAIIACCLYRRRRYGKMTMADECTFISKGIPIIFAEELDDHHAKDSIKSPMILKEEKPPLPPPEYQRGSSPVTGATPSPRGRRAPSMDEDIPYQQPPPPFTSTNGSSRQQRPNMPPTYRKTPTYVPP